MLDLCQKLLGVVGVQAENLPKPFEADILQVAVSQSLHTCVGLNHFFLSQTVRANQVTSSWNGKRNTWLKVELLLTDFMRVKTRREALRKCYSSLGDGLIRHFKEEDMLSVAPVLVFFSAFLCITPLLLSCKSKAALPKRCVCSCASGRTTHLLCINTREIPMTKCA